MTVSQLYPGFILFYSRNKSRGIKKRMLINSVCILPNLSQYCSSKMQQSSPSPIVFVRPHISFESIFLYRNSKLLTSAAYCFRFLFSFNRRISSGAAALLLTQQQSQTSPPVDGFLTTWLLRVKFYRWNGLFCSYQ